MTDREKIAREDQFHDLSVALAEAFLCQPKDMTWEDATEQLARAAEPFCTAAYNKGRADMREEAAAYREFYAAVDPMICVWRDTDSPSSFQPAHQTECDDDNETDMWNRFVAARAAIRAIPVEDEK